MLFSVIVTVYNLEQYLDECIQSILNQTYKNFELILVDDGSTDGSGEICDFYQRQDCRIKVIHKENGGVTSARIAGVEQAQGEYTIYADGDDWVEEDELFQIYQVVQKYQVDLVEFGFYKEYEGIREHRYAGLKEGYYDSLEFWSEIEALINNHPCFVRFLEGTIWCKAVRTDLFKRVEKNLLTQITWGEDALATIELLHVIQNMYVLYMPLYHYRVCPNSMMHRQRQSQIALVEKQLLRIWNQYQKEESKNYLKYMLNYLMTLEEPGMVIEKYLTKMIDPKAKTVLYGKGVFAKGIMEMAAQYEDINIVDIIDSFDVERIKEIEYDEVFIAITISTIVEKCIHILEENGVEESKIKYLTNDLLV